LDIIVGRPITKVFRSRDRALSAAAPGAWPSQ